jgi:hypothetical protein
MRPPVLGTSALLACAALTLAGCGGDDGPDTAERTPATSSADSIFDDPTGPVGSPACTTLTAAERTSLVGVPTPEQASDNTTSRCQWASSDGRSLVLVITMSSTEWASGLPTMVTQMRDLPAITDADRVELDRLQKEIHDVGVLDSDEACRFFTEVARIGGATARKDTMVNFLDPGTYTEAPGVTAQRCRKGWFSSVAASGPALEHSGALTRRAVTALGRVTARVG